MKRMSVETNRESAAVPIEDTARLAQWLLSEDGRTLPDVKWWLWIQETGAPSYPADPARGVAVGTETLVYVADSWGAVAGRGAHALIEESARRGLLCGLGCYDGAGGISRLSLYVPPGYPMTADGAGNPVRVHPTWATEDELRRGLFAWGESGGDSPR